MTVSGQLHVPDAILCRKAQQAGWTPELGCRTCWRHSRPFPSLTYAHCRPGYIKYIHNCFYEKYMNKSHATCWCSALKLRYREQHICLGQCMWNKYVSILQTACKLYSIFANNNYCNYWKTNCSNFCHRVCNCATVTWPPAGETPVLAFTSVTVTAWRHWTLPQDMQNDADVT